MKGKERVKEEHPCLEDINQHTIYIFVRYLPHVGDPGVCDPRDR